MNRTPRLLLGLAAALSVSTVMAQMAPPPPDVGPSAGNAVRVMSRSVTRAEALEMAARRFDMVDTNKDGVLSPEEQQAARGRPMQMPPRGDGKNGPPPPDHGPGGHPGERAPQR